MTDLWERAAKLPPAQRAAFEAWARQELIRVAAVRAHDSAGALAQALDPTTIQTADLRVIDESLEWAQTTPRARLMVSKPSQTGKSERVAIWGTVRALMRHPEWRTIVVTHSEDLALTHSERIRTIIQTYGAGARDAMTGAPMPDRLGIQIGAKSSASRWQLAGHRGGLIAAGVGTALPGRPADCLTGETGIITRSGRMSLSELVGMENRPDVLSYNHSTGRAEWRPILAARTIRDREVVEVVTRGGHTIRCTPDHRIWTSEGYRPAGELTPGTVLLTVQSAVHQDSSGIERQAPTGQGAESLLRQGVQSSESARCEQEDLPAMRHGVREKRGEVLQPEVRGRGPVGYAHIPVCVLREGLPATSVRSGEEIASGQADVLLGALHESRDRADAPQSLLRVRQGDAEKPEGDLLEGMPGRPPGTTSQLCAVPALWGGVPSEQHTPSVLHGRLREPRSFPQDGRSEQLALQNRDQLCRLVQGDAPLDPATGREPLCRVQTDPAAPAISAVGETGPAVTVDHSPHQRTACGQPGGEPDNAVQFVPPHAPQIRLDTVSVVRPSRAGRESVYDIQVAENRNFFAGEILVHNCMILDDLFSGMLAADSPAERRRVRTWWDTVGSQRLGPDASLVMIGTRWNEEDMHAYLLDTEPGPWRVLNFPAIAEPGLLDSLNRAPGVPLENPRGLTDWAQIRDSKPARVWASMYQGNPVPSDGGLFGAKWFQDWRLDAVPPLYRRVVGVDPAETGTGDEAGIVAGGLAADGTVVLTDDDSGQFSSAEWPRRACLLALRTQATELVFEAYSAAVAYEALLKRAYDDLVAEAAAGGGVVEGVRVPASRPFHIFPWKRTGTAVVRSAGFRYATSSGRSRVVGHRLATMEAHAIRWMEGQHMPDRVAAATIVYDVLAGGGEAVVSEQPGSWGQIADGIGGR